MSKGAKKIIEADFREALDILEHQIRLGGQLIMDAGLDASSCAAALTKIGMRLIELGTCGFDPVHRIEAIKIAFGALVEEVENGHLERGTEEEKG